MSDTHDLHRDVLVPQGDLLIHAGDLTFFSSNAAGLTDLNDWLGELPHRYKVVVPGNHDAVLQEAKQRAAIRNAYLLVSESITLGCLQIWGSPVTPHADVAFGVPDLDERRALWASIPDNLDILITHTPPHGVLDSAPGENHHSGCLELRSAVIAKRPRLHIFGHVHGGYGIRPTKHTMFVNAALAGELGDLDKRPIVLDMSPRAHSP